MTHIPLVEYKLPRILMLDFSPQDVNKIQEAGFNSFRAATGLRDHDEFCLPLPIQNVEVLFAEVQTGSFISEGRTKSDNSIEDEPFFYNLLRETWSKCGWIVLFISQNTKPEELASIGLEGLGVITRENRHIPENYRSEFQKKIQEKSISKINKILPQPQMPRFVGQNVQISDDQEARALANFLRSAKMSILTCYADPIFCRDHFIPHKIVAFQKEELFAGLIQDNSIDRNVLALKLENICFESRVNGRGVYNSGRILLLPSFQNKNIDVALSFLQEVIPQISPHLFDTPQHPWLENYLPEPVILLQSKRESIISDTRKKIEKLDEQISTVHEKYAWLIGLLTSYGDQFAADVTQALRFLGFEVEECDNNLVAGERKREDFRIVDKTLDYFALGEAKTTGKGRGASEEFITKTQNHQIRYARENDQVPPYALLIINFAIDLDPIFRKERFYQDDIKDRLDENGITAVNSFDLYCLCQFVLKDQISKEQTRKFLTNKQPFINNISLDEITEVG